MKIALEVDGILLDYAVQFACYTEQVLGHPPQVRRQCYNLSARYGLSDAQAAKVMACFDRPGAWGNLPVIPDQVEIVRRLEALHRVYYVTGVPSKRAGEREKQLARLGLHGEIIAARGAKKEAVFRALGPDVVIDNDPICLRAGVNAGVPLIFYVPPHGLHNLYRDDPQRSRLLGEVRGRIHLTGLFAIAYKLEKMAKKRKKETSIQIRRENGPTRAGADTTREQPTASFDRNNEADKTLLEACVELAHKWREQALAAVPDTYAQRNLAYKYLNADNAAAGRRDCADELADLIEKTRERA